MFIRFVATVCLALGAAGIVLFLNKISGGRMPKWLMPAAVAAAILFYHIFDEYNWASRKRAALEEKAEEYVIVGEYEGKTFWRPWSYINPAITRIDAVNVQNKVPVDGDEKVFVAVLGSSYHMGTARAHRFVFDCHELRYAPEGADSFAPMPERMATGLCGAP